MNTRTFFYLCVVSEMWYLSCPFVSKKGVKSCCHHTTVNGVQVYRMLCFLVFEEQKTLQAARSNSCTNASSFGLFWLQFDVQAEWFFFDILYSTSLLHTKRWGNFGHDCDFRYHAFWITIFDHLCGRIRDHRQTSKIWSARGSTPCFLLCGW